jgi:soluble lytic murein transglycosylase-like protein
MLAACLAAMTVVRPGHAQQLAPAGAAPGALCVLAVRAAELRHALPAGLLMAIAQVESGRADPASGRIAPWPWAVQAANRSNYFDTKAAAIRWVRDAVASGVTSIDTGCLQVNLAFHPDAFATLDDAFDPRRNADYAARFLLRLRASTGGWRQAIGAYHSQTPALSVAYQARVTQALGGTGPSVLASASPPAPTPMLTNLATAWRATMSPALPGPLHTGPRDWGVLLQPSPTFTPSINPPRQGQ